MDTAGNLFGATTATYIAPYQIQIFDVGSQTHATTVQISFDAPSDTVNLFPGTGGNLFGSYSDNAGNATIFEVTGAGFVPASNSAPSIVAQPTNETSIATHTVAFSAAVGGYPDPAVQWQWSTDGGRNFIDITGNASATTPTLTLTGLKNDENGTRYRAIFTNSLGTLTTSGATLTVLPTIALVSPADASPLNARGNSVTLSTLGKTPTAKTPTGESALTYSWSVIRAPAASASPNFRANDSNAAGQVVATFHNEGRYVFRCTISDGIGDILRTDVQVDVARLDISPV